MTVVTLPACCNRAAAEALLGELVAAIGPAPTTIDGTAVTQVGQAMLQLLVSARRTGEGATIIPSDALLDAARLAGLDRELFEDARA